MHVIRNSHQCNMNVTDGIPLCLMGTQVAKITDFPLARGTTPSPARKLTAAGVAPLTHSNPERPKGAHQNPENNYFESVFKSVTKKKITQALRREYGDD
jgi:hypothetical protein